IDNVNLKGVAVAATRRANPTYYDGDLRRELIDTALELIAREGPSTVSLRSLARGLGVSHAAPGNHFPDKAALFTASAIEGFKLLSAAIEDAVRLLDADATAAQRFGAAGDATFALLLGRVRDAQAEGWAAGADQHTVASLAWSVVHGLAALWLGGSLQRAQRPFDEIAGEVGALLGSALAARPAPTAAS